MIQRCQAHKKRNLTDALPERMPVSLRESVDETLTVTALHLLEGLEKVLSSTNFIENLFSRVREVVRRVKR